MPPVDERLLTPEQLKAKRQRDSLKGGYREFASSAAGVDWLQVLQEQLDAELTRAANATDNPYQAQAFFQRAQGIKGVKDFFERQLK